MTQPKWIWVALGALAALAWYQGPPWLAHRRLADLEWYPTATELKLRDTAHAALRSWFEDPHDAFLVLLQIGDETSVPHLERALRGRLEAEAGACTWWHGREALERVRALAGPGQVGR